MKRKALLILMTFILGTPWMAMAQFSGGNGSEGNPYQIASITDWNTFANNVNNGTNYSGVYFELTGDIETVNASHMAGTIDSNKQPQNCFSGTFDGQGHTVNISVSNQSRFASPFKCVDGATIKNLHVTGSIGGGSNSDGKLLAGLVGISKGSTKIIGCSSSVAISTNFSNDAALAGLVAGVRPSSELLVEGCVFAGSMTANTSSANHCGGIVGYPFGNTSKITVKNTLFAPTSLNVTTNDTGYSYTFARHGNDYQAILSIENCYYTMVLGNTQGTQAYKVTLAANPETGGTVDGGTPTTDYGIVKAYSNGLLYNGVYYANGSINLRANANSGYVFHKWSGTSTSISNPLSSISISSNASYTANFTSTEINSTDDWVSFCQTVNDGINFNGVTVTLEADILAPNAVSTMCGTESHPFSGTFDGQGHTMNVSITSGEQGAAPFQYVRGATIKDLLVTGTVSSSKHHAGGLVGFTYNESPAYSDCPVSNADVTIRNCHVSTNVTATSDNDNYCGGIVGHAKVNHTDIIGCVYDGTISSKGYKGGIIGWSDRSKVSITDSYFKGTNSGNGSFNPVGLKTEAQNDYNVTVDLTLNNFYHNYSGTVYTNKYAITYNTSYASTVGNMRAYTITYDTERNVTVGMYGSETDYSTSGIKAYKDGDTQLSGLVYNGTIIAGSGDQVSLTLGGGGGANHNRFYAIPTGTNLNTSTGKLTMPTANVWITNARRFAFVGSWNDESSWSPNGQPASDEDVIIENSLYISSDVVKIHNIEISGSGSITISEGGQLQHCNEGVVAKIGKVIDGYGESTGKDHFYMMALPFTSYTIAGSQLIAGNLNNYDPCALFKFDGTHLNAEWVNYNPNGEAHPFDAINNGEGFLYANRATQTPYLYLTGTLVRSDEAKSFPLSYDATTTFGAWNLVGNPFACNATSSITDYYVIDEGDTDPNADLIPISGGVIAPMQGIFVQATEQIRSITFTPTTENSNNSTTSSVNLILKPADTRDAKVIDVARVRFNEGEGLEKFQLNPSHTKLYIPQGDKDFAVVHTQAEGELPLNLKVEENGRYTLSVDIEKVSFDYLHLIDNRTGADVDLLATPTYTFSARTTDYASRFKLVFAATGIEENPSTGSGTFAYNNGSEWVIANEGNATLQVVDMMGRVLSSETINGSCTKTINAAQGVYMLRLVNGDNVKVQKIVVR